MLEPVKPGDIVDIVAPASACSQEEFRNGLKAIREIGLVPRVPERLFAKSVLFSNSDEQRLRHLRDAVYASDSKMIWCVRGGYGALRLMPELNRWQRPKHAKLFLGYSDITTLHAHFNQAWGWPTLHGPLIDRFGRGVMTPKERNTLLNIVFGRQNELVFSGLKPLNGAARRGRVRGKIVGGNMAVLQSGLGTPSALNPKGRIVFFEDIGERPHRVDRMLEQFTQAGWFKSARAVVFGHFLLQDRKDRRQLWSDVIARFASAQKIPVVAGLPVGHDPKLQMPLPLNTPAELTLSGQSVLKVATGVRRA